MTHDASHAFHKSMSLLKSAKQISHTKHKYTTTHMHIRKKKSNILSLNGASVIRYTLIQ